MLDKRGITLSLTPTAVDHLIETGYDAVYGARPLKRVLQKQIIDPLALKLLQGEIRDGAQVLVDASGDENDPLLFTTNREKEKTGVR
jgi:ATP-dependent Clp protease ATP-binding subunit ClpA